MPEDTLTTLFRHNQWANLRLLERCAGLTDAQLATTVSGAYGSIYDTWQHIVKAERSYLSRITTGQRYRPAADEGALSMTALMDLARRTGDGLIAWASGVPADATIQIEWDDGTPRAVPKRIILVQVINHATEHRAQIMTILTQLGIEPPELDGWTYFDELEA